MTLFFMAIWEKYANECHCIEGKFFITLMKIIILLIPILTYRKKNEENQR